MKIAYSTLACPGWKVEELVAAAVKHGYEALEWRLADGEIIGPETPTSVLKRMRQEADKAGLEVSSLNSSVRSIHATVEEREKALAEGLRMIEIAAELGASFIRVFGGGIPAGYTREELLKPAANLLQTLGEYGHEHDVQVLVESHDAWTSSDDLLALLHAVPEPAYGVLWDIHHTMRAGEDPALTMGKLGSAIAYAHVKDSRSPVGSQKGWQYCLLGTGELDLSKAFATLKAHDYDGYLTLEWEKYWHPEIDEPELVLPQAPGWLREQWQKA